MDGSGAQRILGREALSPSDPVPVVSAAGVGRLSAEVSFTIDFPCQPKQRVAWSKSGRAYTPEETRNFEAKVKMLAWVAMQKAKLKTAISVPVHLLLYFHFAVPKSLSKKQQADRLKTYHISRPDLTNLCKSIEDGCNGVVYSDDSQIATISMEKIWDTQSKVDVVFQWTQETK